MTLLLCGLNFAWIGLAVVRSALGRPSFPDTVRPTIPRPAALDRRSGFSYDRIVGTTIAPWQLFFQQSCVADKRLRFIDLRVARIDTAARCCSRWLYSPAAWSWWAMRCIAFALPL